MELVVAKARQTAHSSCTPRHLPSIRVLGDMGEARAAGFSNATPIATSQSLKQARAEYQKLP